MANRLLTKQLQVTFAESLITVFVCGGCLSANRYDCVSNKRTYLYVYTPACTLLFSIFIS